MKEERTTGKIYEARPAKEKSKRKTERNMARGDKESCREERGEISKHTATDASPEEMERILEERSRKILNSTPKGR